jgi:hypothetical protein
MATHEFPQTGRPPHRWRRSTLVGSPRRRINDDLRKSAAPYVRERTQPGDCADVDRG